MTVISQDKKEEGKMETKMQANRRGVHTWFLLGVIVLALTAFGTTSCRKKSTGLSGTGGAVTGGDQGAARAAAIQAVQSRLQTVYFAYDSHDLGSDAQASLRENASVIEQYPEVRIQIQGHCDERGSEEYNLALGDNRARAVNDYLVNLGISASRLTMISFGEERPIDPGHNESSWRLNRRGEFVAE